MDADLPTLTGWLAALAPFLSSGDPLGWIEERIVPYRRMRHGWVYSAAGLSPAEARRTSSAQAAVLAALRGVTLPELTPDSGVPLVVPAAPGRAA